MRKYTLSNDHKDDEIIHAIIINVKTFQGFINNKNNVYSGYCSEL